MKKQRGQRPDDSSPADPERKKQNEEERAWVERARAGDAEAQRHVHAIALPAISTTVTITLGRDGASREDIEETIAVAHLEFEKSLERWEGKGTLVSFARGIARNCCKRRLSNKMKGEVLPRVPIGEPGGAQLVEARPNPEIRVADAELVRLLLEEFDKTSEEERACFRMHFVEGRSARQIADELGKEVNTVYQTVYRIRGRARRIRDRLQETGLESSPPRETENGEENGPEKRPLARSRAKKERARKTG